MYSRQLKQMRVLSRTFACDYFTLFIFFFLFFFQRKNVFFSLSQPKSRKTQKQLPTKHVLLLLVTQRYKMARSTQTLMTSSHESFRMPFQEVENPSHILHKLQQLYKLQLSSLTHADKLCCSYLAQHGTQSRQSQSCSLSCISLLHPWVRCHSSC